ncbi:peptidoglycan editing factor PgeF [uncultured Algimonas sp.]|uniref:peptidoglycan editing factor PgeF n=1 Tax=uncultured Algimonas sp. TaxID=1547920 RepID=UPI00262175E7|nr:peptidoglycan editing factor PgeF [uncultured Algimonas sp.]
MTDHRVHHSAHLRVPHGFWGRAGGVSPPPWDSLNCGLGSEDARSNVEENRDRVRRWLGAAALQNCWQTHSATAHLIDAPLPERPKGDGLVTRTPGLALAALAADCVPVLWEDAEAGVVGACHAGWRGAVGGILEATHDLMVRQGARDIRAAIGPCIGPRSFEVRSDFETAVLDQDRDADAFFVRGGKLHFDLPAYVRARLAKLGVEAAPSRHDTYAEPDRLFSYRHSLHNGKSDFGRNISAIMLPA